MKTSITNTAFLIILIVTTHGQEPKISVLKQKTDSIVDTKTGVEKYNAEFRVSIQSSKNETPELIIPTVSTMLTRVVACRGTKDRIEIAIQVDEFGIGYFDYRLVGGMWILKSTRNVCALNGQIAPRLAQVEILDEGIIDVKLHKDGSKLGKSGWEKELLMKDHKEEKDLLVERYALQNGVFSLVGEASKYRPRPDTKTKENHEQNKTQQDNR